MIEITESAVRQLRTLVGAAAAEKGLRIGIAKGGCSGLQYEMTLGAARPSDAVIERAGVKFFVDQERDRKSTRLNSSHSSTSYAVFCLKKKNDSENTLLGAVVSHGPRLLAVCRDS